MDGSASAPAEPGKDAPRDAPIEDAPPILGRWANWYWLLVVSLVLSVAALVLLGKVYE
jgi:hypothetical protein